MNRMTLAGALLALAATACKKEAPLPLYEPVPVAQRDIVVSVEAAGTIEPILVVDVKSRASGTILRMNAETGDLVRQGDTLVLVDKRDPTNTLNQAQADLEVARAQLTNAESQKQRTDAMFAQQLVSQQEHEAANLTYANARAQLVRAETAVQTARDAMDDTNVRAPISGTIIAKNVEVGNVIASATRDVTGGVVLLRMADLREVQVRTLVDETDIGKIQPDLDASITVDAYPNRPFRGRVLKIEPQSVTNQNVTMFPVLIRIANENGLLKPGMNAEVQIQVANRPGVLAIPNAALRTQRDVASAAQVLGLNPDDVAQTLAAADSQAGSRGGPQVAGTSGRQAPAETAGSMGGTTPAPARTASATSERPREDGMPRPGGDSTQRGMRGDSGRGGMRGGFTLPPGVTEEQVRAIFQKRRSGETLTAEEQAIMDRMRQAREAAGGGPGGAPNGAGTNGAAPAGTDGAAPAASAPGGANMEQMRAIFQKMRSGTPLTPAEQALVARARSQMGGGSGGRSRPQNNNYMFGGSYIVFALRNGQPTPVRVRTGVTDMDYSEVAAGLTAQDTVLLLPSASLLRSQQEMRDRFSRFSGVPGMRQQTPSSSTQRGGGGR